MKSALDNFSFQSIFGDKETKQLESARQAAQEEAAQLASLASACLNTEQFQQYRRQFQNAHDKILDAMIMETRFFFSHESTMDLNKYGSTMARYITKLEDLRLLLKQVTKDSKKGYSNAEV